MSGDDTTENYHGGDLFSVLANKRAQKTKTRDCLRIREFMISRGSHGATCYEARIALDLRHQTCSARFTDLKKKEHGYFLQPKIGIDGKQVTRLTDTKSPAGVWVANV